MTFAQILTELVSLLTGALTSIGTAMGAGISNMVQALFVTTVDSTTSLSYFAGILFIFLGISLGLSLMRWVVNFVASVGNRNR